MKLSINQSIEELRLTIQLILIYYDVWISYQDKNTSKILNQYLYFFIATKRALSVAMIVELYRIFEPKKGRISLLNLNNELHSQNYLTAERNKEITELIDAAKPIWRKVRKLRHDLFAHRTNKLPPEEILKGASIKHPQEIKKLIEISKKLIDLLSLAYDNSYDATHWSAIKDTTRLLEKLSSEEN